MKRIPQKSAMFGNFAAGCALSAVVIGAFIALVENSARATEPPDPPPQYTLTVNKRGGDSTCEVRLDLPETTGWSTDPIVRT